MKKLLISILLICTVLSAQNQPIPLSFFGLTMGNAELNGSNAYPLINAGYSRLLGGVNLLWKNVQTGCSVPLSQSSNYSSASISTMNTAISTLLASNVSQIVISFSYTPTCVNGLTGTDPCTADSPSVPGNCLPPTDLNSSGSAYLNAYATYIAANLKTNFPQCGTGKPCQFIGEGWNEFNAGPGRWNPGSNWSSSTTYYAGMIVTSSSQLYIATATNTNSQPPNSNWSTTTISGYQMLAWMEQSICGPFHAAGYLCSTPNTAAMETTSGETNLQNYLAEEISTYGQMIADIVAYHTYTNAAPGYNVPETAGTVEAAAALTAATNAGISNPVLWSTEGSWLTGLATNWSGSVSYVPGMMVTSGGNTYVCILASTNNVPPNATYWLASTATDPDSQASFLARWFLSQIGRVQRTLWFSYDLGDGQLYPSGGPMNSTGTAYQQLVSWLVGGTPTNTPMCAIASGTQWTCPYIFGGQPALIVWDTGNYCANGTCTSTNFTVTAGAWATFRDLAGNTTAISPTATTVSVGIKPILLQPALNMVGRSSVSGAIH
jgi:hypothetical protein